MFKQFSLDFIMGLDWDTFYYWHRRAVEIHTGKIIEETIETKVDSETFEIQKKRLYDKISRIEKRKEGTISG